MTILQSIELSNVRRFARDVHLPLSPQATILLAPNGTGKTALFEAIELALTGKVARLESDMYALVREGEKSARVSLDFGAFQHSATVSLNGAQVDWSGPSSLFGGIELADVSYLLRLTHLLDQRDQKWFIQETSVSAGEQLSRLPVGKDAVHVSGILTSLRKAVAREVTNLQSIASARAETVRRWRELVLQRDAARSQVSGEIPDLEELATELQAYYEGVITDHGLDNLESVYSVCTSDNEAQIAGLRKRIAGLNQLSTVCGEYTAATENEGRLVTEKTQLDAAGVRIQSLIDSTSLAHTDATKAYVEAESALKKSTDSLDKVVYRDQIARALEIEKAEAEVARTAQAQRNEEFLAANATLKATQEADDAHARSDASLKEWGERADELNAAKEALVVWEMHAHALPTYEQSLVDAERVSQERLLAFVEADTLLTDAEIRAREAAQRLEAAKLSSDRLKAAVAEIAANLPESQGDCPVCGVTHGAAELHARIAEQLDAIEPGLRSLAEYEQECREIFASRKERRNEALVKNELAITQVRDAKNQRDDIVTKINAARQNALFDVSDIDKSRKNIEARTAEVKQAKEALDQAHGLLAPRPSAAQLLQSQQLNASAAQNERDAAQQLRKKNDAVLDLTRRLDQANQAAGTLPPYDALSADVKALADAVDAKGEHVSERKAALESEMAQLGALQSQLASVDDALGRARRQVADCRERWSVQQLPANPESNQLEQAISNAEASLASAVAAETNLVRIRQQLARGRGALSYQSAQRQVDAARGEMSEPDYESHLQSEAGVANDKSATASERRLTLDTFADSLKRKVEEINSKVESVVPLWQSLLGRMVREPRFSQTELSYQRRYNKPHAQAQVQVSGRDTPVSKVASEAQKTDLQLSFLLAMARTHQWSPWRALLLDDPVQHHDLVHASAVFDVLRDYIVEHQFQTIVTTHDPVQARFFARKLENDGVDVQFVTLAPLSGGVNVRVADSGRRAF